MTNRFTIAPMATAFLPLLLACVFVGCSKQSEAINLKKSIGIMTVGDTYYEVISEGQRIPYTFSETFSNADDNQQAIEITIAQKDQSGIERICVAIIDNLPPKPAGTLQVIVTAKVDLNKNLRLKATVSESGYIKELGPFPVE